MVLSRGGGGGGGENSIQLQLFLNYLLHGIKSCVPANASTVQSYTTGLARIVTLNIEIHTCVYIVMGMSKHTE